MSRIDIRDLAGSIEYKRLVIYIISKDQLEGIISGRARILNLPDHAKIYKILLWRPEDSDNMLSIWYEHESFAEVPPGNVVEQRWAYVDSIE